MNSNSVSEVRGGFMEEMRATLRSEEQIGVNQNKRVTGSVTDRRKSRQKILNVRKTSYIWGTQRCSIWLE